MPGCNAPINVRDPRRRERGHREPEGGCGGRQGAGKAGRAGGAVEDLFMSAASPASCRSSSTTTTTRRTRSISTRSPTRCSTNTRPSPNAGLVLQLDCPDLGMGRHVQYAELSLEEFRKKARVHVDAFESRGAQHPARPDAHAPVLGQLRSTAPDGRPVARHHRRGLSRAAERHLVRGGQPAARARMGGVRDREAARRARS